MRLCEHPDNFGLHGGITACHAVFKLGDAIGEFFARRQTLQLLKQCRCSGHITCIEPQTNPAEKQLASSYDINERLFEPDQLPIDTQPLGIFSQLYGHDRQEAWHNRHASEHSTAVFDVE